MADARRIPTGTLRREIDKVRGSRFLATVLPFAAESDREAAVAALRAEFPAANHHCWAWRLGDAFRWSDDGEPSGSAGRPILQQIDGHGFDRTCVVVTRIFGGTKLGVGGLVRAYGDAAAAALDAVPSEPLVERVVRTLRFDYEQHGAVRSVLQAHGLEPEASEFGEAVVLTIAVPSATADGLLAALRERCAGRIEVGSTQESGS